MSVIWCQNFIRHTRNNLHLQAFNGLCHRGKEALPLSPENIEGHTLAASVKHMASWQGKLQLLPKLCCGWFNSSCIFPMDLLSYDIVVPYFHGVSLEITSDSIHPSTPSIHQLHQLPLEHISWVQVTFHLLKVQTFIEICIQGVKDKPDGIASFLARLWVAGTERLGRWWVVFARGGFQGMVVKSFQVVPSCFMVHLIL